MVVVRKGPGGARINPKVKQCAQCGSDFVRAPSAKFCHDCIGHGTSEGMRWRSSIKLYSVDKFMYEAMYFEQDGKCLVCGEREAKCVDHCHETGRVRGLLCLGCNTLLGFVETPGRLDSALQYASDGKY